MSDCEEEISKMSVTVKSICLILVALLLWHFGGIRLYAQTRSAQTGPSAQFAPQLTGLEANRFDSLLSEISEVVRQGKAQTKATPEKGFDNFKKLIELNERLVDENEKVENYFNQLENVIKGKKLAPEILRRHTTFVREYKAKYETLLSHLANIESAHRTATGFLGKLTGRSQNVNWDEALDPTLAFLEAHTPRARRSTFDPHNLPHRSLKADRPIPPKLTRAEWDRALATDFADSSDSKTAAQNSRQESSASKGGHIGPTQRTLGTAPPTDADLAETIEVKFTPEIRALADSLNKNPVKIYNWVRNNIEFVPTWGSIQGAQLCLETKSCNAFDTSSLLISLLRYSGIPTRYQMGTIEVPIEKFKNWAGGFTNAEAAASLFASGGVPSVVRRVNESGQVVTVKLEHVWVKAFVDYAPSRAAINRQGDTWVELDAGFKQYSFTPRTDYNSFLPPDRLAYGMQLVSGVTLNTEIGTLTNLNLASFDASTASIAAQIQQTQSGLPPEQVVNNLLGAKRVVAQVSSVLRPTQPYRLVVQGGAFTDIPTSLRHTITFKLANNSTDVLFTHTLSLPELGHQRLALNYVASTSADESALVALAAPGTGSFTIPSSVRVRPELRLNEQPLVTGSPVPFGSGQSFTFSLTSPTLTFPATTNEIEAGEQIAIGLDLAGISPAQLNDETAYFQRIENLIAANDRPSLAQQKLGERMLNQIIWRWFSRADVAAKIAADASDAISVRYPSVGFCFLDYRQLGLFGAPLGGNLVGLSMDVDFYAAVNMPKNGDQLTAINLAKMQGTLASALEAQIFDAFFSRPQRAPRWASTATLLNAANAQGIPLTEVNQNNSATILPTLNLPPDIKDRMADAANAGLKVLTPQSAPLQGAYRGVGFIVEDPQTGSAAYQISSGLNGSEPTDEEVREELRSLGLGILTPIAGAALSLLDNFIGLFTGFFGVLQCFAAQGPTFQEILVTLAALIVILVVTFLVLVWVAPWLVGVVAATLFGVSGGFFLGVGTVLLDVLIGLLIVRGSTSVMQGVTGCRPQSSPTP